MSAGESDRISVERLQSNGWPGGLEHGDHGNWHCPFCICSDGIQQRIKKSDTVLHEPNKTK